jgi:soluble lytic murein transglycosylase-like protein
MRFCFVCALLAALLSFHAMTCLGAETIASQPPGAAAPDSREISPEPRAVSVVRLDPRTGRLVRTVVVPHADSAPAPGPAVRLLIEDAARAYNLDPELIDSVIEVESKYNPYAISPKGAQGLMQLMPDTARRFGVKNVFDPKENVEAGVKYLRFLEDTFQDDRLAIAAYNAGERAVAKYGDVPPYKETVEYVKRVSKKASKAKQASKSSPKQELVAQATEEKPADETRRVRLYIDQEGRLYLVTR